MLIRDKLNVRYPRSISLCPVLRRVDTFVCGFTTANDRAVSIFSFILHFNTQARFVGGSDARTRQHTPSELAAASARDHPYWASEMTSRFATTTPVIFTFVYRN